MIFSRKLKFLVSMIPPPKPKPYHFNNSAAPPVLAPWDRAQDQSNGQQQSDHPAPQPRVQPPVAAVFMQRPPQAPTQPARSVHSSQPAVPMVPLVSPGGTAARGNGVVPPWNRVDQPKAPLPQWYGNEVPMVDFTPQPQQGQAPRAPPPVAPTSNPFNSFSTSAMVAGLASLATVDPGDTIMMENMATSVVKRARDGWMGSMFSGVVSSLKGYFNVTQNYVFKKLMILEAPYMAKMVLGREEDNYATSSSGRGEEEGLRVRVDLQPDMYIPLMAFLTYVVLCGMTKVR